jgi:hypothetical protein
MTFPHCRWTHLKLISDDAKRRSIQIMPSQNQRIVIWQHAQNALHIKILIDVLLA